MKLMIFFQTATKNATGHWKRFHQDIRKAKHSRILLQEFTVHRKVIIQLHLFRQHHRTPLQLQHLSITLSIIIIGAPLRIPVIQAHANKLKI